MTPPLPNFVYTLLGRAGLDMRAFLQTYPVRVTYPDAGVFHYTSQNLASLLCLQRPRGRVIVTVHDIIPHLLRKHPNLNTLRTPADQAFNHLAMKGLQFADCLIADSHFTKQSVVEQLRISPDRIDVVHLGIDHTRFRPQPTSPALRERYGLPEANRYLIYVGSEDPRKNLPTLVQALAAVRASFPDVALIKVGRAHYDSERLRLQALATELGVSPAIHWLNEVPDEDMPALYCLAEACVMPSMYEGFGFPALEAMACGVPVICANATSLPEIVGNAGLLVDVAGADMHLRFSAAIQAVLSDPALTAQMRAAGLAQAAHFNWMGCAKRVMDTYERVLNGRRAA